MRLIVQTINPLRTLTRLFAPTQRLRRSSACSASQVDLITSQSQWHRRKQKNTNSVCTTGCDGSDPKGITTTFTIPAVEPTFTPKSTITVNAPPSYTTVYENPAPPAYTTVYVDSPTTSPSPSVSTVTVTVVGECTYAPFGRWMKPRATNL